MTEVGAGKRSYLAMLLSLILPGLGQVFLRKPLKGLILFLGVASAGAIFYINSLPVSSWQDFTRFDGTKEWWAAGRSDGTEAESASTDPNSPGVQEEKPTYHLWTFDDGKKLMYRPSWKLKVSGLIQGVIFWFYAIYDGWRGKKGFNKRAFKKRLREAKEQGTAST